MDWTLPTGEYRGPRDAAAVDAYDGDAREFSADGTGRRIRYADFTTIDWIHDLAKDRMRSKRLHSIGGWYGQLVRLMDASQAWLIVTLIGISCGFAAAFIDICSKWLNDLKSGYCTTSWYLERKFCCWEVEGTCPFWVTWDQAMRIDASPFASYVVDYFLYVLFAIAFAGVSALLVKIYAPYAAGSGIPEVKTILNGFIIRKFLGIWTLIIKGLGLSLSVASGMALGKEGPLVHLSCCFGNIFPRFFEKYARNEAKKREILSAAAAAGVSVAFGAPIGGVLFSLEEVSYYFGYKTLWRSFFCAMVAAVTLQLINPLRTNQLVLFQVTFDRPWHAFELIWFIVIGALGGLFGTFFIHYNLKVNAYRRKHLKAYPVVEAVAVAFVSAFVGYTNVFSRVSMSELVSNLFRECTPQTPDFHGLCDRNRYLTLGLGIVVAGVIKALSMTYTFGIRVPAGIFVPSMTVGACVGRVIGMFVQSLQEAHPDWSMFSSCEPDLICITPGTYALLGAAAFLAGVTRMTVSLVVIMFELTGALTYVVPIIITVIVAKWVGDAFGRASIYDRLIELNGYPFLDDKEEYFESTTLEQIMTPHERLKTITAHGEKLSDVTKLLTDNYQGYPIVRTKEDNILLGFIGRSEIQYVMERLRRRQQLKPNALCQFLSSQPVERLVSTEFNEQSPLVNLMIDGSSSPIALQNSPSSEAILGAGNVEQPPDVIDFRPWVDQTPIVLPPRLPVRVALELFKKLGLRYAIVTEYGVLQGLVTKKDILNHLHQTWHN